MRLISKENMATVALAFKAALVEMLTIRAVFPMEGRAARRTKSAFCMPEVFRSKSIKPVVSPVRPPLFSERFCITSKVVTMTFSMFMRPPR